MKSNFEQLFLNKTEDAKREFDIAEKVFNQAKAKYGVTLMEFAKSYIYPNEDDLRDQYMRDIKFATEDVCQYSCEFPYKFHHPADIYEIMISGHINLIDNLEIDDIEIPLNLEATKWAIKKLG